MVKERWRIRRAGDSDAEGIARAHTRSWLEAYSEILPREEFDKRTVESRTQQWTERLRDEDFVVSVAEVGDEVVGFVAVSSASEDDADREGSTGEVVGLYLVKSAWGSGLGRKMLTVGTDCLARRGFDRATLWALRDNKRARLFYEANGWRHDGGEKDCFGGANAPAVRYRRMLDGSLV